MPLPSNFSVKTWFGPGRCRTCGVEQENKRLLFCEHCKNKRKIANWFWVMETLKRYGLDLDNTHGL